jgi:UDP-glucose 4-epimerase
VADAVRKVAVTGGSGQLGRLVVRRLIDEPGVRAVLSIDHRPPCIASPKLHAIEGDIRDPELSELLRDCDAVVHCAFLVSANAPPEHYRSVNVDGSRNVFRAAAEANVRVIVHLSSMMAYGSVAGHPALMKETSARVEQPDFPYAACKYAVEQHLDEFEPAHPEIAVTRLRPAILLGRNTPHVLGWLLRHGVVPEYGGAPLPIVSDEDVAELVLRALRQRARGAFNASAEDLMTPEEIAARFGMLILSIPKFVALPYQAVDDLLKRVGLNLPYDAAWLTKTAGVSLSLSSARAKRELGWSPRHSTAAAVLEHFFASAPRRLDLRLALMLRLVQLGGHSIGLDLGGHTARVHLCILGKYGGDRSLLVSARRFLVRRGPPPRPTAAIEIGSERLLETLTGFSKIDWVARRGELKFQGGEEGRAILEWMVQTFARLASGATPHGAVARALVRAVAAHSSSG